MRSIFLLPLTVIAAAAGCGSQPAEQVTGSVPKRDLTLATHTLEVKAASPVEVERAPIATRTVHLSRRAPRPTRIAKSPLADIAAPSPVLPVPQPAQQPVAATTIPANDRELLPGKTITLIPASSGSTAGPDETDMPPTVRGGAMVTRGGGRCGGRGRRPGIATAPRPDFR